MSTVYAIQKVKKSFLLKGNNNKQNNETIKTQKKRNNEVLN